jgi:hypothetical protein
MLDAFDVQNSGLLEVPFDQIFAELIVRRSLNTMLLYSGNDIFVTTHLSRSNHTNSLVISSLETSD